MISKELLGEVLGLKCCRFYIENNKIEVYEGTIYRGKFNIYELAYKCKEWILRQHKYSIAIMYDVDIFRQDSLRFSLRIITRDGVTVFKSKDVPENEAIFKACEWILRETK